MSTTINKITRQYLTDIADAIRVKLQGQVIIDVNVSVTGGYNGGAVISIKFDGTEVFHATGIGGYYNLDYDNKYAEVSTVIGTAVITITPPSQSQASSSDGLVISIVIDEDNSYNSGYIQPEGSNTSFGYNFSDSTTFEHTEGETIRYYPSQMARAILSIPTGGGGHDTVPLLSRAEWDALSTLQKQSYGLVAIQDYNSGFERGLLVNGIDYTPDPEFINAYSRNGGTTGTLSHTFENAGVYNILVCWKSGANALVISLNGVALDNVVYEFPSANNEGSIHMFTVTVTADIGDVLTVENTTAYANSGIQLHILKYVTAFTFYRSIANGNGSFNIATNGKYYLQVYKFGYYNGNNTFSVDNCEISNEEKMSIATPNDGIYWYGGTFVIVLQ